MNKNLTHFSTVIWDMYCFRFLVNSQSFSTQHANIEKMGGGNIAK